MAIKKSELYSSLWASCDELRGGMDASLYKDYVLTMLFVKYVSDKYGNQANSLIEVPQGATFEDMVALKGQPDIGDRINKEILIPLFAANNSPHIRIECGYLPSGPSVQDEIANFAFWIGLMKGMPPEMENFWESTDFKVAKSNFIKAARTGIHTILHWDGKNYAAKELILTKLLPLAEQGLKGLGITDQDIRRYLSVIERRVSSENTSAQWQRKSFQQLRKKLKPSVATRHLVRQMLKYQKEDLPVHEWQTIEYGKVYPQNGQAQPGDALVEDLMHRMSFPFERMCAWKWWRRFWNGAISIIYPSKTSKVNWSG